MIAKQYPIALPTDYDMSIIRRRVAEKGGTFDKRPGLLFKAFLISERSHGAPLNQYAPFYVWNEPQRPGISLQAAGLAASSSRSVVRQY